MNDRRNAGSRTGLLIGIGVGLVAGAAGAGWWFSTQQPATMVSPQGGEARSVAAATAADEYLSGAVTLTVREDTEVRDFPSVSGGSARRQQAEGTQVTGRWVRGADANSRWLRLADGGYVHGGMLRPTVAEAAEPATNGPPIRIDISNRNCQWGPDLQPYFDRSIAARERLAAASPDGITPENASHFAAIPNRSWRGLTVTAVAVHWESAAVYFREPVAEVRRVLRANGIEVSDLGEMPIRNEEAVEGQGLDATNAEERRYGASAIICGV
jgi:hypothetical protein